MPEDRLAPALFVAGTDTEVGKTFCSTVLLAAWAARKCVAAGYKPVASGADAHGRNGDVLALQAASGLRGDYAEHNGYTFAEATAPHLAAQDNGVAIDAAHLSAQLRHWRCRAQQVLVEGAGGWHTPLDRQWDFADWVAAERLPVLLVVGMKLGAINHAVLTARAVQAAGLPLTAWVANCVHPETHRLADYVATLSARLPAPLLGVLPYAPDSAPATLVNCVNLDLLA